MRTSIHQQRNKLWTFVSSCSLWFWLWKNKKSKELAAALNESSEPWLINYISKSHDGPEKIIFILLVVGSWSAKACLYQTFLKHFDKFIIQYRGKKLYTTEFFFFFIYWPQEFMLTMAFHAPSIKRLLKICVGRLAVVCF